MVKSFPALFSIVFIACSCATQHYNIAYFKDLPDTARVSIRNTRYKQLLIQPDDILSINVVTMDAQANLLFSIAQPTAPSSASAGASMPSGSSGGAILPGYLVDKDGDVELPILGSFKLAGMTTEEARDTIQARAAQYYKNPVVYVRFANLKITVLGEVSRPGTYVLPNEKNTIFDALGLAGDLTIFAKRDNALLVRDSLGYSQLFRFSLTSKDLVDQPFFFLKQNDVIYIEPNKSKIYSQDAIKTRNYTILVSVVTLLIVIASRINY